MIETALSQVRQIRQACIGNLLIALHSERLQIGQASDANVGNNSIAHEIERS
jgi:hypothetical protein